MNKYSEQTGKTANIEKIIELRKKLHNNPEPSMHEEKTKAIIMKFLADNTNLEIVDRGRWFYAVKYGTGRKDPIAFRADFDAVTCEGAGKEDASGVTARHLCGHDGHSAIMSGFALYLDAAEPERDTYLIFQPGEESGEGAKLCASLIDEKKIEEIYGFHNIPGVDENTVVLLDNTFACASTGLEIRFTGMESHAAHPEQGINPTRAIIGVLDSIDLFLAKPHKGIVLSTVIGIDVGSRAYGVSAGKGTLRLTVRAEYQDEFDELISLIEEMCREKCSSQGEGLTCEITRIEEFPATVNFPECVNKVECAAGKLGLKTFRPAEPFRWSEDFGHYLTKTGGAFFGVGCGKEHAGLHTAEYEFDDNIIETVINLYAAILNEPDSALGY